MKQLRHFGIRIDNISNPLSVKGRLLDKEIEKHNIDIRKPILQKGESFYTKKLDNMHISESKDGFTKTKCGRHCLGNNYADTKSQWVPTIRAEIGAVPNETIFYKGGSDRDRCPTCFGTRVYGDTPLYPSTNINAKSTLTNFEREQLNQAVVDRRGAKQVFTKLNVVPPIDTGDRYDKDYRGKLVINTLDLNRRIGRGYKK